VPGKQKYIENQTVRLSSFMETVEDFKKIVAFSEGEEKESYS